MKPLFLSMGLSDAYRGMVLDHEARHQAYCRKWGMEYKAVLDVPENQRSGWTRLQLIAHFMLTGKYSHIWWIDADSFVADFSRDMRETLPEWAWIGMTIHPFHWKSWEPFHLQAGTFYFRCCPEALEFLQTILARKQYFKDDQSAMNFLLIQGAEAPRWQQGLRILPTPWNSTVLDSPLRPIVAAFHGVGTPEQRRAKMIKSASTFPWGP
jgi:hypothetical protein